MKKLHTPKKYANDPDFIAMEQETANESESTSNQEDITSEEVEFLFDEESTEIADEVVATGPSFDDFELSKPLQKAIADLGFTAPSEIQQQAIPLLLETDRDFVGQAQTGTGKTAAFVLPLLEKIKTTQKHVQALILVPTRELAFQVYEEIGKFSKYLPHLRATTVYGGVAYQKQISALRKDRPQIVVGTPGRILDLLDQRILELDSCEYLVMDEADEMLNMGFIEDVQTIMDAVSENRRLWMFSATLPKGVQAMINSKFNDPTTIKVEKRTLSNEDIQQTYMLVNKRNWADSLLCLVQSFEDCHGIVFCETRVETKELSANLLLKGVSAVALHGEMAQSERDQAMRQFKERKIRLLICTDVAARGIDVNNITHVFNMGLPRQSESYVHRIGRTGRAGLKGHAISFVGSEDMYQLKRIEKLTGQPMKELELPKASDMKRASVVKELEKMAVFRTAVKEKAGQFNVDETYATFGEYFADLDKDEALKVLFAFRFNRDFRAIEDSLRAIEAHRERVTAPRGFRSDRGGRGGRGGGRFAGGRGGDRGGRGGYRGDRRDDRRDDRRNDRRDDRRDDRSFGEGRSFESRDARDNRAGQSGDRRDSRRPGGGGNRGSNSGWSGRDQFAGRSRNDRDQRPRFS